VRGNALSSVGNARCAAILGKQFRHLARSYHRCATGVRINASRAACLRFAIEDRTLAIQAARIMANSPPQSPVIRTDSARVDAARARSRQGGRRVSSRGQLGFVGACYHRADRQAARSPCFGILRGAGRASHHALVASLAPANAPASDTWPSVKEIGGNASKGMGHSHDLNCPACMDRATISNCTSVVPDADSPPSESLSAAE